MSYFVAGAIVVSAVVNYETSTSAADTIAKGQEKASRTQAEAADKALAFQKEQYADIQPYLMRSMEGYQELLDKPEAYKETPGYQFRLSEGLKAIGIPEGAKYLSGTQIKAATRYGQDYASNEYSNALARIAGLGNVAQGVGAISGQYASNVGNILQQQGQYRAQGITGAAQARASATIGQGRAITGAIGQGVGAYQYNQYLNRLPPPQTTTGTGGGM